MEKFASETLFFPHSKEDAGEVETEDRGTQLRLGADRAEQDRTGLDGTEHEDRTERGRTGHDETGHDIAGDRTGLNCLSWNLLGGSQSLSPAHKEANGTAGQDGTGHDGTSRGTEHDRTGKEGVREVEARVEADVAEGETEGGEGGGVAVVGV